jgi:hypothetical protein
MNSTSLVANFSAYNPLESALTVHTGGELNVVYGSLYASGTFASITLNGSVINLQDLTVSNGVTVVIGGQMPALHLLYIGLDSQVKVV